MEQIELIRHAVSTLDALAVPYALVGKRVEARGWWIVHDFNFVAELKRCGEPR